MGEPGRVAGHAFISYVREDAVSADRVQRILEAAGVRVWRDTSDLWAGEDWRKKIRRAITDDALVFIACFSRMSVARRASYQNEELALAIEQFGLRNPEAPWLIPVRFDDCDIPDRDIGDGRTLRSLQCADMFGDRSDEGAVRLVMTVLRILGQYSDHSMQSRRIFPGDEPVSDEAAASLLAEPGRVRAAVLESVRSEASEMHEQSTYLLPGVGPVTREGGRARDARIGMLGPTGCGKTTYLAVLDLAFVRESGNWFIRGVDEASDDFLNSRAMLLARRYFPEASMTESSVSFILTGSIAGSMPLVKNRLEHVPMEVLLDLMDQPGGLLAGYGEGSPAHRSRLDIGDDEDDWNPYGNALDFLDSCDGLLMLFDPVREAHYGDYYNYLRHVLLALSDRIRNRDRGWHLPHRVAVCITKFDDPSVFHKAASGGHVQFDGTLGAMPRVSESRSRAFFRDLCTGVNDADLVMALLEHYFHPDNIKYFATSSIGFYLDPTTGRFDNSDFTNVLLEDTGIARIRGRVRPVNVVEPLLWLAQLRKS
jgi:energy-coupling factor transporter ATP-binding protein EcfA2